MDIYTIHFPYEQQPDDPTGDNCKNSFKLAFGISPEIDMIYNYIYKLMDSTSEWGLIRHSMQALNLCFTQPFQKQKYYLILSKSILGNGQITIVWEGKDSKIIEDTVRQWVLDGQCTPINPYWLFSQNTKEPLAQIWKTPQQVDSILNSRKFQHNRCPTYDMIKKIVQNRNNPQPQPPVPEPVPNNPGQGEIKNKAPWWSKSPLINLRLRHQIVNKLRHQLRQHTHI